jgi:hypothetical protein
MGNGSRSNFFDGKIFKKEIEFRMEIPFKAFPMLLDYFK